MFGGHIWELVIVLALALVVFGPKRLPEIGGAMGKGIREFKKGTSELAELGDSVNSDPQPQAAPPRPAATAPVVEPVVTPRDSGAAGVSAGSDHTVG